MKVRQLVSSSLHKWICSQSIVCNHHIYTYRSDCQWIDRRIDSTRTKEFLWKSLGECYLVLQSIFCVSVKCWYSFTKIFEIHGLINLYRRRKNVKLVTTTGKNLASNLTFNNCSNKYTFVVLLVSITCHQIIFVFLSRTFNATTRMK